MNGSNRIFVFGSNLAGRHGAGAALFALKNHGAIYGKGWGLQGNSYGIPTKDYNLRTRHLDDIEADVNNFIEFAKENPELEFDLTPIGCGLAGYKQEEIKPMFRNKPDNVHFTKEWNTE